MKKLIIIPIAFIAVFLISCNLTNSKYADYEISPFLNEEFSENIQIEIINASVDELSILIKNNSDIRYIYGIAVAIEMKVNNEWLIVPALDNSTWTEEGYYLEPRSINEQTIKIAHMYDLPEGEFRLIKQFTDESKIPTTEREYVAEQFSISFDVNNDEGKEKVELPESRIIALKVNGVDIFDSIDTDWLMSEMRDSEITNIPENKLALDLDVELTFEDNSKAKIKVLDDRVYSVRYNEEHYVLDNMQIVEWLLGLID